jgi:hypothetical protein
MDRFLPTISALAPARGKTFGLVNDLQHSSVPVGLIEECA